MRYLRRLSTCLVALSICLIGSDSVHSQEAKGSQGPPVIESVATAMNEFVRQSEVAGVLTMVVGRNGTQHRHSVGMSDIENKKPLAADSIFWIASMSKPITGVCVMILVDEGKLSLDEPITKYLPEMSQLKLADGTSPTITLKHLLTHTSGMAELPPASAYTSKNLAEAAEKYSQVKVLFPPGSKWQYSQTSINTAARIVEVVSGMPFDQFVNERICKPLGMVDTTFYLNESQAARLAKSYKRTDDGKLVEAPIGLFAGKKPTDRDRMPAANGGLFSTANDYVNFCLMLLNGGSYGGKRILSQKAVEVFSTPASGNVVTGFTPGNAWGIGCCIVQEPAGVTAKLSKGSFGHGGAHGTQAWIDPVKGCCYILMTQRSNFPNSDASELRRVFQEEAAKALGSEK